MGLRGSSFERKNEHEDHGSDTMNTRGHERLEEMSEPVPVRRNMAESTDTSGIPSQQGEPMEDRQNKTSGVNISGVKEKSKKSDGYSGIKSYIGGKLKIMYEPDFFHKSREILNGLLSTGQIVMQKKWNAEFENGNSWLSSFPSKICEAIQEINNLQCENKYKESFNKARCTVQMVESYPDIKLANKPELLAYIYCCMGQTCIDMLHLNEANEYHEKAMKIAEEKDFKDAKSRAHFSRGEVLARKGEYQQAIDIWIEELPNVTSPVGSSLFNFEISRCHLNLGNYLEAFEHGDMSLSATKRAGDRELEFYATVLFAVSEAKLELNHAQETFRAASYMAGSMRNETTEHVLEAMAIEIKKDGFTGFRTDKPIARPLELNFLDDWFNQIHRSPDHWSDKLKALEHLQRRMLFRGEAIPDKMLKLFRDILESKFKVTTANRVQKARELLEISENHPDNELKSKHELMAFIYSCVGSAFLETGDCTSAIQYHEMSWKIASDKLLEKQFTSNLLESTSLNLEIARCFLDLGYVLEALDYGRRSLTSENKAEDLESQFYSALLVAHAEVKLELNVSAERTIAEAFPIIETLNDKREKLIAKIVQGEISCLPDDFEQIVDKCYPPPVQWIHLLKNWREQQHGSQCTFHRTPEDQYARPVINCLHSLYHRPDFWGKKRYDQVNLRRKSIPDIIFRALQEIHDAHTSMNHAVTLLKSRDILHPLENHPQNELLVYQEILAEVYFYMGTACLGLANMEKFQKAMKLTKSVTEYKALCDRLTAHRENEEYQAAINLIQETLSTDTRKTELELTLLNGWTGRGYLRWSLLMGERALAAAGKVADKESQLYLFVLAALCEVRLSFYPGILPGYDQMASIAARLRKAQNMAKALDDKMAEHVIQSVLQEVKEIYLESIRSFLGKSRVIARPFTPVDEDVPQHPTDIDETTRKSDTTHPVPETEHDEETDPKEFGIVSLIPDEEEETSPKRFDTDSIRPDEETNRKEIDTGYSINDEEEETSPKEFDTDSINPDEDINPKEFDSAEYAMSARGEPEGASNPSSS